MSRDIVRERFVERMGSALSDAGLPRLPARVFSALLVDDDGRMSASELAEVLGVSAGSISGAVKYLTQLSMIRRERERGSRRDAFVVDDDAWYEAMMRRDSVYAPMIAALGPAIQSLGRSPARQRLVMTQEFLEFIDNEMTALGRKWDRHRRKLERNR
ncbi:MAG: transcriptional regulator TrmB [Marmoricola sp.]|jgi:DNA-binding transcriptional ArsR family regulator|nr:transcriptional regulator TrmB [Marmoricola sp.]